MIPDKLSLVEALPSPTLPSSLNNYCPPPFGGVCIIHQDLIPFKKSPIIYYIPMKYILPFLISVRELCNDFSINIETRRVKAYTGLHYTLSALP